MSLWKCRYCGELNLRDEISIDDSVCSLHPAGVGNHHFAETDAMQEFADKSNWREGDNGLWHWKGSIAPYVLANYKGADEGGK